jgi:hypothetical protein
MGLFDKKYCDVCGAKIGLFGNRKLADGNLCKTCAAKLSPWFSDRRESTVAEIKEQLAYREENQKAVAAFHTTRTLGITAKVLIDENAEKFLVTRSGRLEDENPDVLDLSQVTGCTMNIHETMNEVTKTNSEGKQISCSPRRYKLSYSFDMVINVNAKWFDEINFSLSPWPVEVEVVQSGYRVPTSEDGRSSPEYQQYEQLGGQIVEELTRAREEARTERENAEKPKTAVTCPHCGATTFGDANGRCEFCGGSLDH